MQAEWENLLSGKSVAFIEDLYAQYLSDPHSIDEAWHAYFEQIPRQNITSSDLRGPRLTPPSLFRAGGGKANGSSGIAERQDKVDQLVRAYRVRGHRTAHLDPLGFKREDHPELDISGI